MVAGGDKNGSRGDKNGFRIADSLFFSRACGPHQTSIQTIKHTSDQKPLDRGCIMQTRKRKEDSYQKR